MFADQHADAVPVDLQDDFLILPADEFFDEQVHAHGPEDFFQEGLGCRCCRLPFLFPVRRSLGILLGSRFRLLHRGFRCFRSRLFRRFRSRRSFRFLHRYPDFGIPASEQAQEGRFGFFQDFHLRLVPADAQFGQRCLHCILDGFARLFHHVHLQASLQAPRHLFCLLISSGPAETAVQSA